MAHLLLQERQPPGSLESLPGLQADRVHDEGITSSRWGHGNGERGPAGKDKDMKKGSVNVDFDLDVICDTCKSSLGATWSNGIVFIEPCEKCLEEEYERGQRDAS
jgi:hypothetical protein